MVKQKDIGLLMFSIVLTLGVGSIGGFATITEIGSWFTTLEKPFFNPPNYLFGPVWSILYFLLGIALYAILRLPQSAQKSILILIFGVQIFLNVLWSFVFFKFHKLGLAAVEMFVLWLFIISLINGLYSKNKTVALMQLPYLLWVTFAFVLNGSIYYLN